jgi:hypothetical protein
MNGEPLPGVENIKDLGVTISSNLKSSKHIDEITSKAYARANLILRAFLSKDIKILTNIFTAYVRPLLEFSTCVWSPYLRKDIEQIEKVQRYYTRRICNHDTTYANRLAVTGLESLEKRRLIFDLTETFKIIKGFIKVDMEIFFQFKTYNRTRGHDYQLQFPYRVKLDSAKYFFANRVISVWNSLPDNVVGSANIKIFKKRLEKVDLSQYCTEF